MFNLDYYVFNPHAVPIVVIGILSLCLGFLAFHANRAAAANRHFLLLCLSIAVWLIATAAGLSSHHPDLAFQWFRLDNVGVMYISVAFYAFSVEFLELRRPRSIWLGYVLASLLAVTVLLSDRFVTGIHEYWWGYYPEWGLYTIPFFLVFFSYMAAAFSVYFSSLRTVLPPIRRNQIKFVLVAFLIAYTGSVDFLPVFGYEIYPFGYIPIFFLICVITYAILRYRLMDVSIVINKSLAYGLLLGIVLLPTYLAVLISHRATFYSIPVLLAGTLVFAGGLWVVLKAPRSVVHRTFGLICAAVCCWLLGMFMLYSSEREEAALLWGKVVYVGVVYVPAFFYHFTLRFLHLHDQYPRVWLPYCLSTVFLLLLPSAYLVDGQYRYFWGFYPKVGPLHPLFLVYFAAVSGRALWFLYVAARRAKRDSSVEATHLRYVFLAFALGYLASADFIPSYGIELYPTGYVFACLWVAIVSYAVLKHQLMDFAPSDSVTRAIPYRQLLTLIPVYLIVLALLWIFTGTPYYTLAGILVATFAVFANVLASVQRRMERAVEKALFTRRYDAYETLTEFSKAMVTILDLKTLNEEILQTLANVMGIQTASLFLLTKEKESYELKATCGFDQGRPSLVSLKADHPLPRHLQLARQPILREELTQGFADPTSNPVELALVTDSLAQLDSEVCLPLLNKERLIGFLNLGHKTRFEMYSQDDLNLLSTLAYNAAIALDNALLYEDLRRQKAIMQRTDRLRSLETIAGGFAHEIRNPLTSIKTFVQLAPDRRDDPEFMGHFSGVVAEDVERIERLIQEILDYARYMEPKFAVQDLNEIVASCLYFIEVKAATKDILIQRDLAGDLPPVRLDRQQVKQVLLNLFLNAMDAMSERGGRLTVRTHRLTKANGDGWVQIEVADTGSGITPENLEHIFDPFYTTKHASGEREGTGLGLTIVHQIVQEHRGYIEVESEVGRGTTFFVNLPVNPLQTPVHTGPPATREAHEKTGSRD
ncbi:ATP-binding protein [Nitrospira sp. Kam-Ns4a]